MGRLAISNLQRRLELTAFLRDHPEINDVPIPPIVMIVGFVRSGTTLLHNLMHRHPRGRGLLRWELMKPLPPPEAATWDHDPRIDDVQAPIDRLRGGALEALHWVDARDPEECPWGYYDCTGLLGRGCVGVMRRWSSFLYDSTLQSTHREYRALVQLLLWRNPVPEGATLVLKSPTSVPHLPAIAETFPDARYVMLHRDPYRALVSAGTIVDTICGPFYADESPYLEDGRGERFLLESIEQNARAMVAFSKGRTDVAHLRYVESHERSRRRDSGPVRGTRHRITSPAPVRDPRLSRGTTSAVERPLSRGTTTTGTSTMPCGPSRRSTPIAVHSVSSRKPPE